MYHLFGNINIIIKYEIIIKLKSIFLKYKNKFKYRIILFIKNFFSITNISTIIFSTRFFNLVIVDFLSTPTNLRILILNKVYEQSIINFI